ncbi:DUF342 domain-containing protein [Desulforhopalus sp. 52FAK]
MSQVIPGVIIHFSENPSKTVSGEGDRQGYSDTFVTPGQLLLSLNREKAAPTTELVSGDSTELSPDGSQLLASCYGYPKTVVTSSKQEAKVSVTLCRLVSVTDNKMEASINLFPATKPANVLNLGLVQDVLENENVSFGVDLQAVTVALDALNTLGEPIFDHLIARGKRPVHGDDAYIRFEVEIGPLPGKILADGTIDFRERLMFVGVKKGQLLACKVPATAGKPGCNLAGEPIEAPDGQDITVKVSDDTYYNEDDGTIRATASGVLSVVNEDTIRVLSKQKIDGDIDYHTGNIRSQNCVEISGSVQPGFIVSVKGNVLIEGNVQSASVNSHGNIIVKGGIVGQKTKIRVQGTAELNHIENGTLSAGGNVVIRSGAYYSSIQAGGDLHCPESVKIIGGDIVASGSVSCGQIGSSTAKPISLAVGVDLARYYLYQNLQKEYQTVLEETQDLAHRHGRAKQAKSVILRREKTLRAIEKELFELNLIPGTREDSIGDNDSFYTPETVTVHGTIAGGSQIRIGNETMALHSEMSGVVIKMHTTTAEIVVNPI